MTRKYEWEIESKEKKYVNILKVEENDAKSKNGMKVKIKIKNKRNKKIIARNSKV